MLDQSNKSPAKFRKTTRLKAMFQSIKTSKVGFGTWTKKGVTLYDSDIPDCLWTEILLRLPLKSIFLSKTVSKRWLSLISDPFFAQSYVNRINNDPYQPWILLFPFVYKDVFWYDGAAYPYSYNPAGFPEVSSSGFRFTFLPSQVGRSRLYIVASSNGLVLCCRDLHSDAASNNYYVCNPLTKQYVILPEAPGSRVGMKGAIICQDDGSYTIVRIPNHLCGKNILELQIFSSETGTWRKIKFPCRFRVISLNRERSWYSSNMVTCNGILHWTAEWSDKIFVFDRCTNLFYLMDIPERGRRYFLANCCSRLCCLVDGDTGLTLWELTNYELGKWHLKHTGNWGDMWSNDTGLNEIIQSDGPIKFNPLAIHPFDLDTVYVSHISHTRSLFSCNFRTKMLEQVGPGLYGADSLDVFVLPPWPTLIPQPSWGTNKRRS